MRLKHVRGADEEIQKGIYFIKEPKEHKGKWSKVFQNENPIYIEIGMGKGDFIIENAIKYPEINFIGIEKYDSVIVRAIQKSNELELNNLKLIRMDARFIEEVFDKEVDRIYLNFSDPWPKDRHAKRRLPSRQFLQKYDVILKKDGVLEFKTDNKDLFDFAVEELPEAGWKAKVVTYDLHNDEELVKGNVMTEYEEKFSSMGNPICKYIIYR